MTSTPSTSWKDLYRAAMLELDRALLPTRIEVARAAMRRHAEAIRVNLNSDRLSTDGSAIELRAIEDGLRALESLQRVELSISDATGPRSSPSTLAGGRAS
jgi:hypothetical protein